MSEMTFSQAVAESLRSEFGVRRVNVSRLAQQIGIHRSTIHRILNDDRIADVEQLELICGGLGISLLDLFADAQHRQGSSEDSNG